MYEYLTTGKLIAYKLAGSSHWKIDEDDLLAFIAAGKYVPKTDKDVVSE
jgi:hypothetical protein